LKNTVDINQQAMAVISPSRLTIDLIQSK